MKFVLGRPPESEQFSPLEDGWTPLREPTRMWVLQLACIPVGVALAVAVASLASAMGLSDTVVIDMRVVLALAVIIPLHELLHAVSFPARLSSPRVMFGFWPAAFAFYAHYDGEMTRDRFLAVLLAPLLALSVLPLFILKLLGSGGDGSLVISSCVINAFCSSADVLGACLILLQVPRRARMRNQGMRSFWRVDAAPVQAR